MVTDDETAALKVEIFAHVELCQLVVIYMQKFKLRKHRYVYARQHIVKSFNEYQFCIVGKIGFSNKLWRQYNTVRAGFPERSSSVK